MGKLKTGRRNVILTNWGSDSSKLQKYGVHARRKVRLEAEAAQEQLLKGTSWTYKASSLFILK